MKSEVALSELAARSLSAEARRSPGVSAAARARTIEAMAGAIRLRKRQRWGAIGSAVVATAAAAAIVLGRGAAQDREHAKEIGIARAGASAVFVTGAPAVISAGVRRQLSVGTTVNPGDRIIVEAGSRATVALSRGTYLVMENAADVSISSLVPAAFDLAVGSVHADVAKLGPGERFVIRTADAEVEVHGTSFEVSRVDRDPSCGNGTTTRVKVFEGIVAVRANGTESLVHPHEEWPRGCVPLPNRSAARDPSAERDPPPAPSVEPPVPGPVVASPRKPIAPASDLAAQNDLFDKALARKRVGDTHGAVALFDEVLTRYPSSHLAQSARAERMKLLRGMDPERARAAARDYLNRHPNGFARPDADLILGN